MKYLIWLLLPLHGLKLASQMDAASPGDYIVTTQDQTVTLILVREKRGDTILIEEIDAPLKRGKPSNQSWPKWVNTGAPRHTSWIAYRLNLKTGDTSPIYSYTKKGWIKEGGRNPFFATLLSLDFKKIPNTARKRVGPRPRAGAKDTRKVWHPPLVYDGHTFNDVPFNAWEAIWPQDQRKIIIYTPREGNYPSHFPYWVEIVPAPSKIRVIDSGKTLESPQPSTMFAVASPLEDEDKSSSKGLLSTILPTSQAPRKIIYNLFVISYLNWHLS